MKKFVMLLMVLVGAATAWAGNYDYLTFETTDGAKVSVPAKSLKLSINGTTLTTDTQTFTLSNLARMYFSASDETTAADGVCNPSADELLSESTEIYDLNGRRIVNGSAADGKLPRGVYIVKTKSKTYKIAVK